MAELLSKRKVLSTNGMIKISLLSVVAFVLMQLEFSIPIFPFFLKLDVSDIPAILGGLALGPISGVLILMFKNILNCFVTTTGFIGELANFCVGFFYIFTASFIYQKYKTTKSLIIGLALGTLIMSLAAAVLNYYFFIPAFAAFFGAPVETFVGAATKINGNITTFKALIYWMIIPFNLLKGLVVSIAYMMLHRHVTPIINNKAFK
ncbi:Riboflavin transporter FmnP [Hathewaya proteolytica DSM 3090]|uniref:Riboflavin transporter n=1 Tax=Hathewaya proteolytica DSM 3090 TaxID=1121331 RepID=A0A1M6NDH5_9CLOT|nr:ECF transporter S component [Hathewaya proteolytica]SHJ93740.1 Riboflavin transporter FmnP [Hathewaya proteolytica DSM 3090]